MCCLETAGTRRGLDSVRLRTRGFYGNEWKLIAELHLTYADGSEEVIGTDEIVAGAAQ